MWRMVGVALRGHPIVLGEPDRQGSGSLAPPVSDKL